MKRAISGFGVNFKEKTPAQRTAIWRMIERLDALFRGNGVEMLVWWVHDDGVEGLTRIVPLFPADMFPEAMAVWDYALDALDKGATFDG